MGIYRDRDRDRERRSRPFEDYRRSPSDRGGPNERERPTKVKELVEYIATSLVENPGQVQVKQTMGLHTVNLELHVAPEDMGKVIGRQGRIASAVRSLLRVAATREGRRINLDIV